MPAELKKINPAMDSTPEMLLGMLLGYRHRIKHLAAVVIWDDDSYQLINDPMTKRDMAWSLAVFQKEFFDEL